MQSTALSCTQTASSSLPSLKILHLELIRLKTSLTWVRDQPGADLGIVAAIDEVAGNVEAEISGLVEEEVEELAPDVGWEFAGIPRPPAS